MDSHKNHESALKVNQGVEQPPSVDAHSAQRFISIKRKRLSVDEYVSGILSKDRMVLSRAITLIESSLPEHQKLAQQIIEKCLPYAGNSYRIGISGVPGAGKSTFIEALGKYLTQQGHQLAVLAIDPSSGRSKGSILGDKTRMEDLSNDPNAFIRPSPSAGSLGGVARKTRESIVLCEAAGFDVVFVETVGVGQSETAVHSMVDFFLLVQIAGAGDELQGIKRGIMEMADGIVINKADGTNIRKAEMAANDFRNALHLFPLPASGWSPLVMTCSAYYKTNIDKVWEMVVDYFEFTWKNDFFSYRRREQAKFWMYETINNYLHDSFYNNTVIQHQIEKLESDVLNDKVSSFIAARKLLEKYFGTKTDL
ncbi:MAG: ATPase/protein kinase [Bacteroidetes bacterium GWA2_40_14]|jgi:LAO/AO transport system kinase|nr:MAG: ATPase/protein kinase [Bacteroidetes bacterium GWA2_40_14]HAZ01343.1 methylmalonyl Co-A mutase-associated GTPase MeaB [Marinilabiliales bacterium]